MHVFCSDERTDHGTVRAFEDAPFGLPAEFADDAGIAAGHPQRHIAGDCRDAEEFDFIRAAEGKHEGGGIVLTGVGVDDDLAGFCHKAS